MFTINLDATSFYIYTDDESLDYILKELCTEECLTNFWDKDSDLNKIELCENDILEYYLTKPTLASWERKLVTMYLDYMIDRSFTDLPCGLAMNFLKKSISFELTNEFIERLNSVVKSYFLDDIIEAIKVGASYE